MEITVQTVYEAMARLAPPQLAESWDNVGLLVDCGKPVARALTALDITPEVVEEARRLDCGIIVSHHPVIFSPLKKLGPQDVPFLLVQAGISAVCMHTNYDAAGLVKRLTPPGGDDVTGRAIVDRLTEMCYYIPMTGKSHRQQN